jgi:NAD(P)-dependent dehydrogenase (short-subunit alcohol dehydrogenase family)
MEQRALGRFAGAAVIVTGGAHGIGRACVARFAEEGAHIAVADLDQTRPNRSFQALRYGGKGADWSYDV